VDAGEPVKAHDLDHRPDLRLGAAQQDRPATHAQAARDHGEVEHQGSVSEHKVAEVDDHVVLRADRSGERGAPASLRRPVLVATASKNRGLVIEVDDGGESYKKCRAAARPATRLS
jgi:hypothetical protein